MHIYNIHAWLLLLLLLWDVETTYLRKSDEKKINIRKIIIVVYFFL